MGSCRGRIDAPRFFDQREDFVDRAVGTRIAIATHRGQQGFQQRPRVATGCGFHRRQVGFAVVEGGVAVGYGFDFEVRLSAASKHFLIVGGCRGVSARTARGGKERQHVGGAVSTGSNSGAVEPVSSSCDPENGTGT